MYIQYSVRTISSKFVIHYTMIKSTKDIMRTARKYCTSLRLVWWNGLWESITITLVFPVFTIVVNQLWNFSQQNRPFLFIFGLLLFPSSLSISKEHVVASKFRFYHAVVSPMNSPQEEQTILYNANLEIVRDLFTSYFVSQNDTGIYVLWYYFRYCSWISILFYENM